MSKRSAKSDPGRDRTPDRAGDPPAVPPRYRELPAADAAVREQVFTQAVLDSLPGIVYLIDAGQRVVRWNRKFAELSGLTPDELDHARGPDFIPPEYRETVSASFAAVFLRGESSVEAEFVSKDGTRTPCYFTGLRLDIDGEPYMVGMGIDISELRAAQAEARRMGALLAAVVNETTDAVFAKDREGRYLLVNPAAAQFVGRSAEDLLGHDDTEFFDPEGARLVQDRDRQVMASGEAETEEERLTAAGVTRVYLATKAPLRDETGETTGIIGISRDITDRKRAEDRLRESEARFRTLVEHAPEAIVVFDPDAGCFVDVNDNACRLFGYSRQEMMLRGPLDLSPALQPDGTRSGESGTRYIGRALAGESPRFEWAHVNRAGGTIPCEISLVQLPAVGRRLVRGSIVDISERRAAEEERRRLEAQVLHAQKLESVGILAGGIAHDFNNLLTSMLGYASLALTELPEGSPVRPMLTQIQQAARRAADLTGQMLAYAGKGKLASGRLRLDRVVEEMSDLMRTVVSKTSSLELDLEPAVVDGDAARISQVVMNLITNASDALGSEPGTIRVRTRVVDADREFLRSRFLPGEPEPGTYAMVEVADTGCGMDEETVASMFDPFFSTKFTGRGLGLAAVLGIVRGHAGTIKVDTAPGRGTVFQVLFPAAAGEPDRKGHPERAPEGRGLVLVIEDEADLRNLVAKILEDAGFDVVVAGDGREGLARFAERSPEVAAVLLDLTMPGMDGVDVLRALHAHARPVPVLMMSGFSEGDVTTRYPGFAAAAFLQKPFDPPELLAALDRLLKARG